MHLKDGGSLVYLPAVESPLSTFENLRLYNVTVEEELESVSDGQLIITKAADLDDVSETFNMVKESSPNLVAALTGKSCIYSRSERVRRAVNDSTQAETTGCHNYNCMIKNFRRLACFFNTQCSGEVGIKTGCRR